MKPLDAMERLEDCMKILAAGHPLPPLYRAWIVTALHRRLSDPQSSLDRLLELRSRQGGSRLHAGSTLPARDAAVRQAAGDAGTVIARAEALRARILEHRAGHTDPEIERIESEFGTIPSGVRQLHRIISGKTGASCHSK